MLMLMVVVVVENCKSNNENSKTALLQIMIGIDFMFKKGLLGCDLK